nr:DUF4314 domain-containing protein [uncultured Mediterraneibacter sp.]
MLRRDEVERLKQKYRAGMRVRLIKMDDIQAPPSGTEGTIINVDDTGTIRVYWDTGSSLSIITNEDKFEILTK